MPAVSEVRTDNLGLAHCIFNCLIKTENHPNMINKFFKRPTVLRNRTQLQIP